MTKKQEKNWVLYDSQATKLEISEYLEIIGSLGSLAIRPRPGFPTLISICSRYLAYPSPWHASQVRRCLRYLRKTTTLGITLGGKEFTLGMNILDLDFYVVSDSNWVGCLDTRRSKTGYLFFLAGGPISKESKRLPIITLSSTKADYYYLSLSAREAAWLRKLL